MIEVELTETGKAWILEEYSQGSGYEYDIDKPFKVVYGTSDFTLIISRDNPYRIPNEIDGKPTFKNEKWIE